MTRKDPSAFGYPRHDILLDPYAFYDAMRTSVPVYKEPHSGTYFVTRHEDVTKAARCPAIFSSRRVLIPDNDPEIAAIRSRGLADSTGLTAADPPDHQRFRSLVSKIFTVKRFAALEPEIRALANELVDGFIQDGRVDLQSNFSSPLPLIVIARLLDLDHRDVPQLKLWSDDYTVLISSLAIPLSRERQLQCIRSTTDLQMYFSELVDQRRVAPGDDVISQLVMMNDQLPTPLDHAQLVDMLRVFLIGGNETTAMAISTMMYNLLLEPEHYHRVRDDASLIPAVIEETLRFESPTQWAFRTATQDTQLSGTAIPAGATVGLAWGAANRDAMKFGDTACRFDPARKTSGHVAFGFGAHFCAGAPLARLEMKVALETFLNRLQNMTLVEDEAVIFNGHPVLRGITRIFIDFDMVY